MQQDHLEKAREYLAIAEAEDSKRDAYWKAADEVIAAFEDGMSYVAISAALGRGERYAQKLAAWRQAAGGPNGTDLPFSEVGDRRVSRDGIKQALADPGRREDAAKVVAEAMKDPEVAHAVTEAADPQTLNVIDAAAATTRYTRERPRREPPEDAASRRLGGVGPGAMADKLFNESMEPMIHKVHGAISSARLRWLKYGFRLSLTEISEFDELDAEVTEIGRLYAEMLDLYDAAKAAKVANEEEGARAT